MNFSYLSERPTKAPSPAGSAPSSGVYFCLVQTSLNSALTRNRPTLLAVLFFSYRLASTCIWSYKVKSQKPTELAQKPWKLDWKQVPTNSQFWEGDSAIWLVLPDLAEICNPHQQQRRSRNSTHSVCLER